MKRRPRCGAGAVGGSRRILESKAKAKAKPGKARNRHPSTQEPKSRDREGVRWADAHGANRANGANRNPDRRWGVDRPECMQRLPTTASRPEDPSGCILQLDPCCRRLRYKYCSTTQHVRTVYVLCATSLGLLREYS